MYLNITHNITSCKAYNEKIVKNKEPIVITVSKEDILSETDNFLLLANDTIKNLLKDDDCEIVSVVYIKQTKI